MRYKILLSIQTVLLLVLSSCTDHSGDVSGVSLNRHIAGLDIGEQLELVHTISPAIAEIQTVSWSSDNESAAAVDQSGRVEAVSAGIATITVTTDDGGFSDSCTVYVDTARFISRWNTGICTETTEDDTIWLPWMPWGQYDFLVDWGDGVEEEIAEYSDDGCYHTYDEPGFIM